MHSINTECRNHQIKLSFSFSETVILSVHRESSSWRKKRNDGPKSPSGWTWRWCSVTRSLWPGWVRLPRRITGRPISTSTWSEPADPTRHLLCLQKHLFLLLTLSALKDLTAPRCSSGLFTLMETLTVWWRVKLMSWAPLAQPHCYNESRTVNTVVYQWCLWRIGSSLVRF